MAEPANSAGDFNQDGLLDVTDLDVLTAEVRAGAQSQAFDLNGDGAVDDIDRTVWVEELKGTFFGDTNLDGSVDETDLNEIGIRWLLTDVTSWADGDLDGNGEVDRADLNLLATNWQRRAAIEGAVPEPAWGAGWLAMILFLLYRHH